MRDAVLQPVLDESAIRQACQRIMQSHLFEFDVGGGEFRRTLFDPPFQIGIQGLKLKLIGLCLLLGAVNFFEVRGILDGDADLAGKYRQQIEVTPGKFTTTDFIDPTIPPRK